MQVVEAPEFTLVGLQARPETKMGATRLKVAVWEALLSVAVMVTLWVVLTMPAVAVKLALLAPLDTVTEVGTLRLALLTLSATLMLDGASWFRVTTHVLLLPEDRLEGLHCTEARVSGGNKVSEVVRELLPSVAVMTAVCVVVKVPVVAVKPTAVCPAVTTAEAGTVSAVSLDDKMIVAPD